jgi:hypothetical protein
VRARSRIAFLVAVIAFALGGCGCGKSRTQRIVAERDGGEVLVHTHDEGQTVEVRSAKGMGAADIPLDERRPRRLDLVFYDLQALEQLLVSWEGGGVEIGVSASGAVHQSAFVGVAAQRKVSRPLALGDSDWMPVRIARVTPEDSTSRVASIRIGASEALRQANATALRIEWVDFFR